MSFLLVEILSSSPGEATAFSSLLNATLMSSGERESSNTISVCNLSIRKKFPSFYYLVSAAIEALILVEVVARLRRVVPMYSSVGNKLLQL